MKNSLNSLLIAVSFLIQTLAADHEAAPTVLLKDNGLPAGAPSEALPQNAIAHLQINDPQLLLENLEQLIMATAPEKLLPPKIQELMRTEHPVLTALGMRSIRVPLTSEQIAERTGLATDQPASLTLYPGLLPRSIVVSLPIHNHARFDRTLRSILKERRMEAGSIGDKSFVRIELNHPQCRELFVACSSDRVFITGEQSLLLLAYADNSSPRLKDSRHFAELIETTGRDDIWLTFDPALIKPILGPIELFKYMPLKLLSEQRGQLLAKVPAQQRELIEQRLRIQFGIRNLEQLADYAECVVSATYQELFEFVLTQVKSFNGVTFAVNLEPTFNQATVYLHSDQFQRDSGTQAIPLAAVRTALARVPGSHRHITITGREPRVEPSPRIASWLKRIRAGFEAKQLNLAWVDALEALHRNTIRPQPVGAQVPWLLTTRVAVNPYSSPADAESVQAYFRGLNSFGAYPAARTVTVIPDASGRIFEDSLRAEREALIHNGALLRKTLAGESSTAFLDRAFRLNRRDLDHGVQELTWESAFVTRGGLFGFNQHELVSRRIFFARTLDDYSIYHQASRDPRWIGALQLQGKARISPGLAKLLDRIPEGANCVAIHRPLAATPALVKWIQSFEELLHRDAEHYLAQARRIASETTDRAELVRKLETVKFSPVLASVNRDPESGELYGLLPGNFVFPRPKVGPALATLFEPFSEYAEDTGGLVFYRRVSDRKCEASVIQNLEGISKLINTVGNAVCTEYLETPDKKAELKRLLVTERDRDPDRMKEVLVRNPSWEFLSQIKTRRDEPKPKAQTPAKPGQPIAARDPQAPAELIDLSAYYTSSLNDSWQATATKDNHLGSLPQGIQEFAGTKFDVRGIVQLSGKDISQQSWHKFPEHVMDIRIGRTCRALHFLHATGWQAPDGTKIGTLLVRYHDGQTEEIPIVYGVHVRDWWTQPNTPPVSDSVVAWKGSNPASGGAGVSLQLYKTSWKNPRPEASIASLDYQSAMSSSAPFLIAVTAE